jgi:hypothetical protein
MNVKNSTRVEGGYPLAAVVLLVTTVAALLACIDMPRVRQGIAVLDVQVQHIVGLGAVVVSGAAIGGILGLTRPRWIRGALFGASTGAVTALMLILLTVAPANLWQCLSAMALLVATSIVVRWKAR